VIRVLLVDDHALVRAGLRALLRDLPGIDVVAEAGEGREALKLVKRHRPDVVVMDIAMPELNGLDATASLKRSFPDVRVVVLSMHANEEYVLRAVRAGATGYVLKGAKVGELEFAINAVARGDTYLAPSMSKYLVGKYLRSTEAGPDSPDPITPRHREVLQLIAEGRTSKSIAGRLGISVRTVEAHRAQLMERLDIHDIAGLVHYAISAGLVPPPGTDTPSR
jgi:DNA-binding NarL/FixJ family response regulator